MDEKRVAPKQTPLLIIKMIVKTHESEGKEFEKLKQFLKAGLTFVEIVKEDFRLDRSNRFLSQEPQGSL